MGNLHSWETCIVFITYAIKRADINKSSPKIITMYKMLMIKWYVYIFPFDVYVCMCIYPYAYMYVCMHQIELREWSEKSIKTENGKGCEFVQYTQTTSHFVRLYCRVRVKLKFLKFQNVS